MDSLDQQVLRAAQAWAAQGLRFALITVVRTWGSAPRQPGAWLALREDGVIQGSVSGGCVEDDLVERMLGGGLLAPAFGAKPHRLIYGASREEAHRLGLPCGGQLELVVEPAPDASLLAELSRRLDAGQLVRRHLDLASGLVTLNDGTRGDVLQASDHALVTPHGPRWRLLIIGAGQTSTYLAQMALALDYDVIVCDPRESHRLAWNVAATTWAEGMPDDVITALAPDPHCAIVALTHDPKLDDLALLEALKSPAFYVGALGSALNNAQRRERLRQHFDLNADEIGRLHGPVGLAIGSKTPPEIAVAILAEMIAVRRGALSDRHHHQAAEACS